MNSDNNFPMPFGATIGNNDIWIQLLNRCQGAGLRPALFLDRDGVIVEDTHYLHRIDDVSLITGAAQTISLANALAIPVVIVTNQSGIGRGIFDWQDFAAVQERILTDLADQGAFVNAVLACPFHADGTRRYRHPDHPCRKPNPGMIHLAVRMLPIDLSESWIIGDRTSDLAAAQSGGLAGGLHVRSGHGTEPAEQSGVTILRSERFDVIQRKSIADAATCLPLLTASGNPTGGFHDV